jgi:hypothetical protein
MLYRPSEVASVYNGVVVTLSIEYRELGDYVIFIDT